MNNFLFEITEGPFAGERFFVCSDNDDALNDEVWECANDVAAGMDYEYLGVYDDDDADALGYDTY